MFCIYEWARKLEAVFLESQLCAKRRSIEHTSFRPWARTTHLYYRDCCRWIAGGARSHGRWHTKPPRRKTGDTRLVLKTESIPGERCMVVPRQSFRVRRTRSVEIVITDPPIWSQYILLRPPQPSFTQAEEFRSDTRYPDLFGPTKTPNAQEALAPSYYRRRRPCETTRSV